MGMNQPPDDGEAPVLHDRIGRVGRIRLNRPRQMNALNDALMEALGAALLAFDADDGIGCILLQANGPAFAAGADIAAMVGRTAQEMAHERFITRNWETVRTVKKPVVAAVHGLALGGGCELALACDIVIAADDARFGLPEVKLAMLPGAGGTQRLPRAIGKAKAMDVCLSARLLTAAEAERDGLISRVVPVDQLQEDALALASAVAEYSLPALLAIKESINGAWETPLSEGMARERQALYSRFDSPDAQEGLRAFLEKRRPVFRHR